MSPEVTAALIGAIVGGGISAAAGWVLQYNGERRREARLRELFRIVLTDDLSAAPELLTRLRDDLHKTGLVWRISVNEIVASRDLYWKYKEHLVLFDPTLRKDLATYYLKTQQSLVMLEAAQQFKDNLADRTRELARNIILQTGKDANEAEATAKEMLHDQVLQAQYSDKAIHQEMDKLVEQIAEARRLKKHIAE